MTAIEDSQPVVNPPVVVLTGPTAVGKSALALALAAEFDMDIVSADSRQVYRYLDIGTAKPTADEQAKVRHFMLDLVEPDDVYTAGRFATEGGRVLRRLGASGRRALVVGGTGFYIRSLLDGIRLPGVQPDPERRRELLREAEEHGTQSVHERLAALDPASAQRIHANNLNRVVRALEIVEALNGPVPELLVRAIPALYLGLTMDRRRLHEIADARAVQQVRAGLVDETRLALDMGYSPQAPALQGFAYRQMVDYLSGKITLPAAIQSYQLAQHRFIRRQMTWFRADDRIHWIEQGSTALEEAREAVANWLDG